MTIYRRKVLVREHEGCSVPIPVPSPWRIGPLGDPPKNAEDITPAIFLCTECGLASLYHISDYGHEQAGNDDPFERGIFHLAHIYAECSSERCKHPIKIHVIWDNARNAILCKHPKENWKIDSQIKCPNGYDVQFNLGPDFQIYFCQMPF
jgi:hypothetical protein